MKHFRIAPLLALSLFAASLVPTSGFAAAPQIKTQAPGYHRTMVGKIEVTTLFDGFFPMKPKELLPPTASAKVEQLVKASDQEDLIPTSVNGYLINTGSKLILVDAGCGAFFGPSFGKLMENLRAAGYTPEQVDEVEITHMHTDHLGGVLAAGKAAFPQAVLRMDKRDADYWLNVANAKGMKEPLNGMFANAVAAVAPYQAAGRFKPFEGQTEIAPGITAIPNYGHTPGHTVYSIESEGKKLMLIGDLVHIEAVQLADPSLSPIFDSDPKLAATLRKKVLGEAASQKFSVAAAHLPFPGIGHIVSAKPGFRYLPAPYAPLE